MMIKITKNVEEANLITHGGTFHADEVMATVILAKILGDVVVYRASKMPEKVRDDVIVYDIGYGQFDHHQRGGNGYRENDIPYAACGLIWKEFGYHLVKEHDNAYFIWKTMDVDLIQGIDAVDTGTLPKTSYRAYPMSVPQSIFNFNPAWDSEEPADEAFLKAASFAEMVFDKTLEKVIARARAKEIVEEAIAKAEGNIMVMERFAPWQKYIFTSQNEKAKEIQFVVFPSNREGYNWQGVPVEIGSYELRCQAPMEWRGLQDNELRKVTGVKTAIFCHQYGFIGSAETLEDAITMARLAIEAKVER